MQNITPTLSTRKHRKEQRCFKHARRAIYDYENGKEKTAYPFYFTKSLISMPLLCM
jgi:hypothetical protein